jgi:hypothetical protein
MADDDLIVVRDFLLKGLPWDLSRPRFMDFQREQIREKAQGDPAFLSRLRQVALEALRRPEPEVVCRGLTALAFVGVSEDISLVNKLAAHSHPEISKYAKTCAFEIKKSGGRA